MKCTSATILGLLIAACCLAQGHDNSQAGFEIGSLIMRTHFKAFFSHQIFSKWSITGNAAIAIHDFSDKDNEEEEKHKAEFDEVDIVIKAPASSHTSISLTYWPQKVYDGVFISTGGKIRLSGKADCTIKAGYCMKLYKWLTLTTQYGTDLIASYKSEKLEGDGIEICIGITF